MAGNQLELKSGYLKEDFRLFHINDKSKRVYESHYHDFHKIIFFRTGNVAYQIEGRNYELHRGDILLVNADSIHRPVVDPDTMYDRIIIWLKPEYVKSMIKRDDITDCFQKTGAAGGCLLQTGIRERELMSDTLERLMHSLDTPAEFGSALLSQSLFLEFMVYLNRCFYKSDTLHGGCNEQIASIMQYINEHLTEDLNLELLAAKFYLSRYHLMHKFKTETGYTVHSYILQKRLSYARRLVESEGLPITKAALLSGFGDYSSFYRAYRKEQSMRSDAAFE